MSKQIDFLKRCIALNLQSGGLLDLLDRIEELERKVASRDAEIAELVEALEDNWNCNPCETTRQQKAFDVAQSVLAKVRKP